MSGPGLKHVDSHSAIHEAALNDALELNDILENLLFAEELEKALEVAYVAVEHWETRTLQHATAEEEGLYKDLKKESPELSDAIVALTRDHEMLRLLVDKIQKQLDEDGFNDVVLQQFQALIIINTLHNEKEEAILPHH